MNRRVFLEYLALTSGSALPLVASGSTRAQPSPQGMKTVGLIGGTSWHSTLDYYRSINALTNERLGAKVNPPLLLANLNQAHIHALQANDDWTSIREIYHAKADILINAGAEAIVFCANTPHKIADQVQRAITKPILHIADATAEEIKKQNLDTVGLTGTSFTMTDQFFVDRLKRSGIETKVPDSSGIEVLHDLIINKLTVGVFTDDSKKELLSEINKLLEQHVQGIVLACTEFPLILKQSECPYPIFDTTAIHCKSIVDFIVSF